MSSYSGSTLLWYIKITTNNFKNLNKVYYVYGSTYQTFFNLIYRKRSIKSLSKSYKRLNWKFFFYNWNQHTQHRTGLNMTKTYLLNSKLWYFQKKNFTKLPVCWKKDPIMLISKYDNYIKIESKIDDSIF